MKDHISYRLIANEWRSLDLAQYGQGGIVMIYGGKAYGWKDQLRDPQHEAPGSVAVTITGDLFKACGGDEYNGAEQWVRFDGGF